MNTFIHTKQNNKEKNAMPCQDCVMSCKLAYPWSCDDLE